MRKTTGTVLFASMGIVGGGLVAAQTTAQGGGAQAADAGRIDEIVVTARKREESLQEVPISITAFTSEQIERQRIESIADIAQFTPGLVYQDINANLSIPVIRGLAQTNILGADNNVAMFLNGIYLSNNRTLDVGMIDLERVEVIKGPQSALYGQNSFAGAINYVTRRPGDALEAEFAVTSGSDELREARAAISGPIGATLSGRLSASWKEFDGTFENRADPGDNLQGYDTKGVSGDLAFSPTDRFEARLFGYWVEADSENPAQYLVANNCGRSAGAPPFGGLPTYFCGALPANGVFDISPNGPFGREAENRIASLDLTFQLAEAWTLKSITALVETESSSYLDFDFTSAGVPFPARNIATQAPTRLVLANTFLGQGRTEYEDLSQELRLEFAGERLDFTVGAYYYDSDRRDTSFGAIDASVLAATEEFSVAFFRTFASRDPIGRPVLSNWSEDDVRTQALFGLVGFDLLENLRVTAELRWAEDKKQIARFFSQGAPVQNPPPNALAIQPFQEETFDYVTPRVTVDWQLGDAFLLYGSYAEGARTGGFNARATRADEGTFDPEENRTYEIGAKTQWLDRRLTFNTALYYVDWKDLQINSRSVDPANIFGIVRNTGNALSRGVEVELRVAPTDSFQAGIGYAYTDPRFKAGAQDIGLTSLCGVDQSICRGNAFPPNPNFNPALPPGPTNPPTLQTVFVGGNQLGRTINHQYNAFAQYQAPLGGDWQWYVRGDWALVGKQPMSAIGVQYLDDYSILNARLGFESDRYEVALWGKNLTDEEYLTASSAQPRFHTGTVADVTFAYGRIYGLTASVKFGR
jgi:iron complex outermembrane receptor protein